MFAIHPDDDSFTSDCTPLKIMIHFQLFPRSVGITPDLKAVVDCFSEVHEFIKSPENNLSSNAVLKRLRPGLEKLGFRVEAGKTRAEKIPVPVLFGLNNRIDKHFDADALSGDGRIVLEVEAGRARVNNAFLKDIFQAAMMHGVEYLVLAVRNDYRGCNDFAQIHGFLETLYVSNRLILPLRGIVLLGY